MVSFVPDHSFSRSLNAPVPLENSSQKFDGAEMLVSSMLPYSQPSYLLKGLGLCEDIGTQRGLSWKNMQSIK